MDRDPWQVMGLSRGASQDEVGGCRRLRSACGACRCSTRSNPPGIAQIKEQWRRLCKQHHPDLQVWGLERRGAGGGCSLCRPCRPSPPSSSPSRAPTLPCAVPQPEHLRQSSTQYFKEISGAYRALTARERPPAGLRVCLLLLCLRLRARVLHAHPGLEAAACPAMPALGATPPCSLHAPAPCHRSPLIPVAVSRLYCGTCGGSCSRAPLRLGLSAR